MDQKITVHQHKKSFWKIVFDSIVVLCECSIFTVFVGLALLAVLPLLPTKQYIQTYIIPTGSMSPTIPVGALAFISPDLKNSVWQGDIVAFVDPQDKQKIVVHRIINVKRQQNTYLFQTKGDNNNVPDPWQVGQPLIRGEFLFAIPYVGYMMSFIKTELGFFLFIGIPAVLLVVIEFKHIKEGIDDEVTKRVKKNSPQELFPKFFILFFLLFILIPMLRIPEDAQGILVVSKALGPLTMSVKDFNVPILSVSKVDGSMQFAVKNVSQFDELSYTITYDTAITSQKVQGKDHLNHKVKYTSPLIILGTCSSGVCVYDKGVHNIRLSVQVSSTTSSSTLSKVL